MTAGVASDSARASYRRGNATLLFTDIVDSTAHLVRVGDDAWTRVLDEHDRIVADLVTTHGGRLIKHTGDGVIALFSEATSGVACARRLISEVARLGIMVRTGLHSGECLIAAGDVCGLTAHVAARVAGLARGGEVRVSQATRDLVAETIGEFVDCGPQLLRGLPGKWPLFALPAAFDRASPTTPLAKLPSLQRVSTSPAAGKHDPGRLARQPPAESIGDYAWIRGGGCAVQNRGRLAPGAILLLAREGGGGCVLRSERPASVGVRTDQSYVMDPCGCAPFACR